MPSNASKLLEGMRRSKAKWKRKDLLALYKGYGFEIESGSKHDKVWHPDYPQLFDFIPRHTKLAVSYIAKAVKLVDRLIILREMESTEDTRE